MTVHNGIHVQHTLKDSKFCKSMKQRPRNTILIIQQQGMWNRAQSIQCPYCVIWAWTRLCWQDLNWTLVMFNILLPSRDIDHIRYIKHNVIRTMCSLHLGKLKPAQVWSMQELHSHIAPASWFFTACSFQIVCTKQKYWGALKCHPSDEVT